MAIYERGKGFQAKFRVDGRDFREQFRTRPEAEAWERAVRDAVKLGKAVPDPKSMGAHSRVTTMKALVEFTDTKHWSGNVDCRSADALCRNARLFSQWVGENRHPADALTEENVQAYAKWKEANGSSGSTINRHVASIRKMLKEAVKMKLVPEMFDLPKRAEGQARMRVYTPAEEAQILATLKLWSYDDLHDLFVFLVDTGARVGESTKLEWPEVNGTTVLFLGETTKNRTERVVGLTPRAREALARMKAKHGNLSGPFVWVERQTMRTIWDRLRGHLEWLDDQCVIHTFRHTCLSRLVQKGASLYQVQRWAGHKTPMTTQRYAKFAPRDMESLAGLLST